MKKLSALVLSASAYLMSALPVAAQGVGPLEGNLCPVNATGEAMNFNPLCLLYNNTSNEIIGNIINIIFIVVVLLALLFLIYGGIKWITSGGDKAGVESARNMIVAALVGLVIAFLAYFILQIIFQLFGLEFNQGNFFLQLQIFTPGA